MTTTTARQVWVVTYGTRGAMIPRHRTFGDYGDAYAFAVNWRRTGEPAVYWALDPAVEAAPEPGYPTVDAHLDDPEA